jgi:two-component system, OmpR family, response regulator MprA
MRVLVIEDDRKVASFIQTGLEQEGYAVDLLNDGMSAGEQARAIDYDAVVLDLMLPGRSGFQVLRDIRARKASLPVLILTAKDSLEERVAGLDAGADDYLAKPFALDELRARLRALLRRSGASAEVLRFADVELDLGARRVERAGRRLAVTKTELALLELFLRNPRRVLNRTQIFESVWGYDFGPQSNALWVYISYLRNKLEADGGARLIQTVRGLGYVLREEP